MTNESGLDKSWIQEQLDRKSESSKDDARGRKLRYIKKQMKREKKEGINVM